jgi:hypothetical protein
MSEQTVMSYEDETVDVYLSAALTDLRLHWRSLVDDTTGALRDTDQGSMVTRAAYAISEALKRGKRNAERIAELEAENMRLRADIKPSGTTATNGAMWNSDAPDPRKPPAAPLTNETYTHNVDWNTRLSRLVFGAIVIAVIVTIAFTVHGVINPRPPYTCPREHNGYPLVSFQIHFSGDEVNCRYGTEEIPQ